MRSHERKHSRGLIFLGTVILLLAACVEPPGSRPGAFTEPVRQARGPLKVITVAVGAPILSLSPRGAITSGNSIVTYFEMHSNGLTTSDARGRAIPQIARELPSLDSGTIRLLDDGRMTTQWSLRPDVTWHDSTPFTARDLVFGFRVNSDPELSIADRFAISRMASVEEIDPHTIVVHWAGSYYLGGTLGPMAFYPLPAHLLEADFNTGDKESFQSLPFWLSGYVHTGPFRLARVDHGSGATFEAYDGYFQGRPKVDQIVVKEILDANAGYAGILAGEVDVTIEFLDGGKIASLQDQGFETSGGRVFTALGPVYYLGFQAAPELVSPKELLDARVRRALYFGLDRAALADLAYGGRPTAYAEAKSIIAPTEPLWAYVGDIFADSANDPPRALQGFAQLGWTRGADGLLTNGAGTHLEIEVRTNSLRVPIATALADMWKRIGIDSKIFTVPQALQQDREFAQAFPGTDLSTGGQGDRILPRYDGNASSTARNGFSGNNRNHYNNPRATELVNRFNLSIGEAEQGRILKEIADIAVEDLPLLPIYYYPVYATVGRAARALDDLDGGHTGGGGYFGGYVRAAYLWERI
jgi:peptide/nickel transport system substrate-binding protein